MKYKPIEQEETGWENVDLSKYRREEKVKKIAVGIFLLAMAGMGIFSLLKFFSFL